MGISGRVTEAFELLWASAQAKLATLTPGAAVASVSGQSPIVSSGGTTPVISIAQTPLLLCRVFTASTVVRHIQSDVGLTLEPNLQSQGTFPPIIKLLQPSTGMPRPMRITVPITAGARGTWVGSVSYDDGGSQSETFLSGSIVTLLSGAVLSIDAGNASLNNIWDTVVSGWADSSGNGNAPYLQPTLGAQPLITAGLGGKPGILGDGVASFMASTMSLPAPATARTFVVSAWRQRTWVPNGVLYGTGSGTAPTLYAGSGTPNVRAYCGINGTDNAGAAINSWVRSEADYHSAATDYLKVGAVSHTDVASFGNNAGAGTQLFAFGGALFGNYELLTKTELNAVPTAAQLAAYEAVLHSYYSNAIII